MHSIPWCPPAVPPTRQHPPLGARRRGRLREAPGFPGCQPAVALKKICFHLKVSQPQGNHLICRCAATFISSPACARGSVYSCRIIPAKLRDPAPPSLRHPPDTCFSARGLLSPARCFLLEGNAAQAAPASPLGGLRLHPSPPNPSGVLPRAAAPSSSLPPLSLGSAPR